MARLLNLSNTTKSYLSLIGVCLIYLAMGPYLAIGNTGVYLTSYLINRTQSEMKIEDSIWLLAAGGFSGLLLPLAGQLEGLIGVRAVCLIGGLGQSFGILATYYTLDISFTAVALTYGGAYLFSLSFSYASPVVNVCKWHPEHKGLVTGIATAAMAVGPILFIPMITELVNPDNQEANERGVFVDDTILDNTKASTLIQGLICLVLFLTGITLCFPADSSAGPRNQFEMDNQNEGLEQSANGNQKDIINRNITRQPVMRFDKGEKWRQEVVLDPRGCSIAPRFAIRTLEFWILSLKMFITELIYIYMLFMYKPYGQTFIHDDHFLSAIGAGTAISNTVGRITMGYVKDRLGYQAISIVLSWTTMFSIALMPMSQNFPKLYYGSAVLLAVGSVGSQYALMPSAVQDCFGDKHASINIGLVYVSMTVSTLLGTFLSHHFTSLIGWDGMIYIMTGFAVIDFLATLCLPSKPTRSLIKRFVQFYGSNQNAN